jgi:hypothetical protein
MMVFREISAANDWAFGQGRGSYLTRERAVGANIKTRLLFFLNDCFFAMSTGIDWWNLLGTKNPAALNNILIQTRQVIASSEGVVRINSVTVDFDSKNRSVTINYNIDSTFSRGVTGNVTTP